MKDPQQIYSSKSYTDPYAEIPQQIPSHIRYPIRHFQMAWNPRDLLYTDGSHKTGNPPQSASVANPITRTTTHVEVKSQPERHTINRAKLEAITLSLELYHDSPQLRILIDSAFSINAIRNYIIDPLH